MLENNMPHKQDNRTTLRKEVNFYVLDRNVKRSPAGIKVEIIVTNPGLKGSYGCLKTDSPTYALKSEHGFIIGFSRDKDDLILLIAEHGWLIDDPEIAGIAKVLMT